MEALVAPRTEQQLSRDRAQHLDDLAEVVLDSNVPLSPVLTSAASKGKHELLAALFRRLEQRSSSSDLCFPPSIPELCGAWLAAAEKGYARCLSLILDTCKQRSAALQELLEEVGEGGNTALMLAAWKAGPGHLECMRLLLEHSPDAQVTYAGDAGYSAVMYAAECDKTAAMQLLLAHSPDQQVAAVNGCGWNALMYAAGGGCVSCLQLLLAHSPDAQLAVEPGADNALSAAAGFLLEAKARSSADGAVASDHQHDLAAGRECVELLLSHGAQLPDRVSEELRGAFWPIVQEAVRRARVPDMANAAVVGLALAAAGRGKRPAEGELGGAGAGPSVPKAARTHA